MSDRTLLHVGDTVEILAVPVGDIRAYERGLSHLKETIQVLEWMVGKRFRIESIDEYGNPWIHVVGYPDPDNAEHTMALMDDASWTRV